LAQFGVPYSIVRPTWIFGGQSDILANNIAWILRRMPAFALPGTGTYPVQPVHVDDLARVCIEAARFERDAVIDAAGPETIVRDVVLTRDEIRGLMAGLLVSQRPPLGTIAFSQWLDEHRASVGRSYANELHRHFTTKATATTPA
jgi:nucleoside-diphosphate-sugar epimerase